MFLIGLLKLNYFPSLLPFLESFIVFELLTSWLLGVEDGLTGFNPSNSSLLISVSSGLLYDPDSPLLPRSSNSLLLFSSVNILTKGELMKSLVLFFLRLNSKDC